MLIEVKNGDMVRALRDLKRKLQREGDWRVIMSTQTRFICASDRRRLKRRKAQKRNQRDARRRARADQVVSLAPHHAPGCNIRRPSQNDYELIAAQARD